MQNIRFIQSPARFLLCAVLLPAAVAASNYALLIYAASKVQRVWLYPWMAFSVALLSWVVGRYLSPALLRCLVFGWSLALLDLLTITACLGGVLPTHFAYALVSAQVGALTLWGTLAPIGWQWRLPTVLSGAAIIILFCKVFDSWGDDQWKFRMLVVATIVTMLCGALRLRGFTLRRSANDETTATDPPMQLHQFGVKHMLIWTAALVPILIVLRGIDFLNFLNVGNFGMFPFALLVFAIAIVNMVAIWSVLGSGPWPIRLGALLVIPPLLATSVIGYMNDLYSGSPRRYDPVVYDIAQSGLSWRIWLCLDTAFLAALLLFLLANGYRLGRAK